jgi:hypothetical protein
VLRPARVRGAEVARKHLSAHAAAVRLNVRRGEGLLGDVEARAFRETRSRTSSRISLKCECLESALRNVRVEVWIFFTSPLKTIGARRAILLSPTLLQ